MATLDAPDVIRICTDLWQSHDFSQWRTANINRSSTTWREEPIDIPGLAALLEARTSALEIHGTRYVNKIASAQMKIQVTARTTDSADADAAQTCEDFLYSLKNDWRLLDVEPVSIAGQVYKGVGIIRPEFHTDILEQLAGVQDDEAVAKAVQAFAEQGFQKNPFTLEAVSIDACAFEPDRSVWVEVGKRSTSRICLAYPNLENEDGEAWEYLTSRTISNDREQNDQRMVDYYHLEDKDYIYDVIGWQQRSTILQCRPNPIGRPWYAIATANLSDEDRPVLKYRPALGPVYAIAQRLSVYDTLLSSGALAHGRPVYQLVDLNGRAAANFAEYMQMPAEQRPVLKFDLLADQVHKPPDGKQYVAFPVPDMSWVLQARNEARQDLQEAGFPMPLSPEGSLQASAQSGYKEGLDIEKATIFIDPMLKGRALQWQTIFVNILDLIRQLNVPVTVPMFTQIAGRKGAKGTVTLKPEDIREFDVEVSFDAKSATAEFAERESDNRQQQIGMMSRRTALARRYEDPEEEDEQIAREKLSRQLDQEALADAMEIIELSRQYTKAKAAQKLGIQLPPPAGQQQMPEGVQPQPGGPAPGMDQRVARPAMGPVPGVGSPLVPQNGVPQ